MLIANYLHTIVISGYWGEKEWQSWGDELIIRNYDKLDIWIYDVAFAQTEEDLYLAIALEKTEELYRQDLYYWEPDIVVGYYYLMYKEGRMSFDEMFNKFSDEDDISGGSCIHKILLQIYSRDEMSYEYKVKEIERTLSPYGKMAEQQLNELELYSKTVRA